MRPNSNATVSNTCRWSTALLADGNVGIGGSPVDLLRRLAELLSHSGRVVVEVDPPGAPSGPVSVRVEHKRQTSDWFPWAHVSVDHLPVIAEAAGFALTETWEEVGRWFAVLTRA